MVELVRCRPCGYVMRKDKLGEVCPACGLPHKVFEDYREKVSSDRKLILALDLHPIAIHLSQSFIGLLPVLLIITKFAPNFYNDTLTDVINFFIYLLPFTIIIAFVTGAIDGYTRFRTLTPPLLKIKIILGTALLTITFVLFFITKPGDFNIITIILATSGLGCAVFLGIYGKKLLDVILPGSFRFKKKKKKQVKVSK